MFLKAPNTWQAKSHWTERVWPTKSFLGSCCTVVFPCSNTSWGAIGELDRFFFKIFGKGQSAWSRQGSPEQKPRCPVCSCSWLLAWRGKNLADVMKYQNNFLALIVNSDNMPREWGLRNVIFILKWLSGEDDFFFFDRHDFASVIRGLSNRGRC